MLARITGMTCSRTPLLLMLLASLFIASAEAQTWNVVASGIETNLRGVSVVGDAHERAVVWSSGSNGVVIVSKDEGQHWKRLTVQGGETLDFRGIVAFSESTAYLMSSGEGQKSRIYKTTDGGASWKLQYSDDRKDFFLDAIQCLSETDCYALGDPMDRKFVLPRTKDGEHWEQMPTAAMPAALPQEGAFAASNSCLRVDSQNRIYFVTGGPAARMFHSGDRGATWQVSELPLAKGNPSSGAFSIAVSRENIVVAGGDYRKAEQSLESAAYSMDGGATWKRAALHPGGFRSAVASAEGTRFIVAGPNGSDVSNDHGEHWKRIDSGNWNAVAMNKFGTWAVGPKGTVARLQ
jgi:photosystem II stability/assembly factor-like uncharacterized protein